MEFTGKWQAEKKDDLEAAMKTIGIPEHFANISRDMKLQLEILKDGDTYTFRETANIPLSEHKVTLGEDFTTVNWLGKQIKGVVHMDGNKMVEKSKEGDVLCDATFRTEGSKLIRTRDYAGFNCSLTYTKL